MKKYLALLLALALCLSLCACGGTTEDTTPTEPEAPKVEDDGIMKILLIGHSLGTDSSYLFPDICRNEGMENLVFGRLAEVRLAAAMFLGAALCALGAILYRLSFQKND